MRLRVCILHPHAGICFCAHASACVRLRSFCAQKINCPDASGCKWICVRLLLKEFRNVLKVPEPGN